MKKVVWCGIMAPGRWFSAHLKQALSLSPELHRCISTFASDGVVIWIVDENTFVTWLMFNISLAIVKFFLWSLLPLVVVTAVSAFISISAGDEGGALDNRGRLLVGERETLFSWLVVCSSLGLSAAWHVWENTLSNSDLTDSGFVEFRSSMLMIFSINSVPAL